MSKCQRMVWRLDRFANGKSELVLDYKSNDRSSAPRTSHGTSDGMSSNGAKIFCHCRKLPPNECCWSDTFAVVLNHFQIILGSDPGLGLVRHWNDDRLSRALHQFCMPNRKVGGCQNDWNLVFLHSSNQSGQVLCCRRNARRWFEIIQHLQFKSARKPGPEIMVPNHPHFPHGLHESADAFQLVLMLLQSWNDIFLQRLPVFKIGKFFRKSKAYNLTFKPKIGFWKIALFYSKSKAYSLTFRPKNRDFQNRPILPIKRSL